MPYVNCSCREQTEIIVMIGSYDHVALGYLERQVNKRAPGEQVGDVLCGPEHFFCDPYHGITICITYGHDIPYTVEY